MVSTLAIMFAAYAAVLLALGYFSYRATGKTPEEYFLAGRSLGPVLLFFSIFATNITAFTFLGVTGQAYREGIGLYGLVAFGTAFITPVTFYIIGYRSWLVGKVYGYMTQAEMLGARWDSRPVSIIVFVLLLLYTVPYLVTSIIGAGTALEAITGGTIPYGYGALGVVAITTLYTSTGGMRGTAWTNVFQGVVFLVVGLSVFLLLGRALGGFVSATDQVLRHSPELMVKGDNFTPGQWLSYLFISPLAVVVFPHVFVRLMACKSARYMQSMVSIYPIMVLVTFAPAVLIGVWGAGFMPGLSGAEGDAIFPLMLSAYLPQTLTVLGLAGILAAIMSSVDAMMLTISNMLIRDLIAPVRKLSYERMVWLGRLFVCCVAVCAFVLAIMRPGTIFAIATYAFTGFACMAPVIIGGLYWRQSTAAGAIAALVVSAVLLPVYQFTSYLDATTLGFFPVMPLLVITVTVFFIVSTVTRQPDQEATQRFFSLFDRIYGQRTGAISPGD